MNSKPDKNITIHIDRKKYRVDATELTGPELRVLAAPDIGDDRDLWLDVPAGPDQLMDFADPIQLRRGMHFFSSDRNCEPDKSITIHIDRKKYRVDATELTGPELRVLAAPDIGDDRDLWLDVPAGPDQLMDFADPIQLRRGMHFFSSDRNCEPDKSITIHIDRKKYRVDATELTGPELRVLAAPDIGDDRDLWLDVPAGPDQLIDFADPIQLHDGMHFFSSPRNINPG